MGKPTEQGKWIDALGEFSLGMNSDPAVVALPKNQCAFATNCTFRGNFVTFRPPYQEITLTFDDASEQSYFEDYNFQGACYFKPDFGPEQIVCSIGGRLFTITPTSSTNALVNDVSPTNPNPPEPTTAWMWQSETFVIVNDGQSIPEIYNGTDTVRANQGELVATIQTGGALPEEGSSVSVTFTADYTGPQNSPLYLYNPGSPKTLLATVEVNTTSSTSGYKARLTNIGDTPGTVHPSGAALEIINSWSGISITPFLIYNTSLGQSPPANVRTITVSPTFTPPGWEPA